MGRLPEIAKSAFMWNLILTEMQLQPVAGTH